MKRVPVLLAALAVAASFSVAGCSSSSKTATPPSSTAAHTTSTTAGSSESSSSSGSSDSSGKVDCAKVKAAAAELIVDPQHLASLTSADAYSAIKDGTVSFDPATFSTALADLAPLESVDLGSLPHTESVKQALDAYGQANDLAKQALASSDPYNSTAGQQLAQQVSNTATFLGHQTVISEAITAAHCD